MGPRTAFVRAVFMGALALAPAIAHGDVEHAPIHDTENRFRFTLPAGLNSATPPPSSQALHYHRGDRGLVASVTRFDAANRAAFRKDEHEAFFDAVERGLRQNTVSFQLRSRKSQRLDRVPTLDIEFTRENAQGRRERVWMRMLFRYRFTVVATATVPAPTPRRLQRLARSIVRGLVPLAQP